MANGQLPTPNHVQDLLLTAAATGAALGHMDDLQAVLLEGRAWQAKAADVLQQQQEAAAAAAVAVESDGVLWGPEAQAAAERDVAALEVLIGRWGSAVSLLCFSVPHVGVRQQLCLSSVPGVCMNE